MKCLLPEQKKKKGWSDSNKLNGAIEEEEDDFIFIAE